MSLDTAFKLFNLDIISTSFSHLSSAHAKVKKSVLRIVQSLPTLLLGTFSSILEYISFGS